MTDNPFVPSNETAKEEISKALETMPGAFSMGVITSITGGLYAQIEKVDRTISIKRLASYTPVVGHRVLIAKISSTFVVLGRVV